MHIILKSENYCFLETKLNGNEFIKQMVYSVNSQVIEKKRNASDSNPNQFMTKSSMEQGNTYIFELDDREEDIKRGNRGNDSQMAQSIKASSRATKANRKHSNGETVASGRKGKFLVFDKN